MNQNRRNFLKRTTLASAALAGAPVLSHASLANSYGKPAQNQTVLFQGDSITDAGRDKKNPHANNGHAMGHGYAFLAASQLLSTYYSENLQVYNRGISGNKVYQLADRWQTDAFDLKPDVLSVLIGINDYWHMVNGRYDGTVEKYETDYRALLQRTTNELPSIKLIICEPFAVWGGKAITDRWEKELPGYQASAAKLADEFDAQFVPFQKLFNNALKKSPASVWCPDGVHPSLAGAQLMADAWVKAFNKLY